MVGSQSQTSVASETYVHQPMENYYYSHLVNIQGKIDNPWSIHGAHHRNLNAAIQLPILALPPRSRILDAGCGLSIWISPEIEKNYVISGLDDQAKSIEFCKSHFKGRSYSVGSIYETPYENDSFDAVVMREVIEHLYEPEKAVMEIKRILKPGGLFIVTTPNYDSWILPIIEQTYNRFFGGTCKPYLPDVHPSKFHFNTLRSLLDKHFDRRLFRSISFGISLTGLYAKPQQA